MTKIPAAAENAGKNEVGRNVLQVCHYEGAISPDMWGGRDAGGR
jgi:hypothetical protein